MNTFDDILARFAADNRSWQSDRETLRADPAVGGKQLFAHNIRTHGFTKSYDRRLKQRAAGAQLVKDAIDRQYGVGGGAAVFQKIKEASWFGWRDLNRSVSRGDLRRIKAALNDLGFVPLPKPVEEATDFAAFYDRTKLADRRRINGAKVFAMIRADYGEDMAQTLFSAIPGGLVDGDVAQDVVLTTAHLDLIKQHLDDDDRFTDVYPHFLKPQSDMGAYIGYNIANGEVYRDPLGNVEDGSVAAQRRKAFGLKTWQMVVRELDEERALDIFRDVFGDNFSRNDRAIAITYKDIDAINARIKAEKIRASDVLNTDALPNRNDLVALHGRITELFRTGMISEERHLDYERLAALDPQAALQLIDREENGDRPDVMDCLVRTVAARAKEKAAAFSAAPLVKSRIVEQNSLAEAIGKLAFDGLGAFSPQRADALIHMLKSGDLDITLTQDANVLSPHTHHMIRVLTLLRDDPDARQTLNDIDAPRGRGNPARDIVRATLGLAPDADLTPTHSRQVALGALLSNLRQASGVGSCFTTAAVIQVHNSDPARALWEMKQLIETGRLTMHTGVDAYSADMNRNTGNVPLEKAIWLDEDGILTKVKKEQITNPVPFHTVPSVRAALTAMGVPTNEHENTIKNALTRFPIQPTCARAILQVVAIDLQNRETREAANGALEEDVVTAKLLNTNKKSTGAKPNSRKRRGAAITKTRRSTNMCCKNYWILTNSRPKIYWRFVTG